MRMYKRPIKNIILIQIRLNVYLIKINKKRKHIDNFTRLAPKIINFPNKI
jgi:hypothetical protein